MEGKTARGASSPAKPALHIPEPSPSPTSTAGPSLEVPAVPSISLLSPREPPPIPTQAVTSLPPVHITWHDSTQDFYYADQLEQYKVLSKLGQGQFGIVKKGQHVETKREVALKIVGKGTLTQEESRAIKMEAKVMTYLCDANVIRMYEVIENPVNLCMVLEYAAGGELFDHIIRQTKIKEIECRNFFVQMLSGMKHCHSMQIVHRDLKAENIFLDGSLTQVKIGDFGFAALLNAPEDKEDSCGSLDYAAPEILSGQTKVSPSADVWALGVVLYFMISGWLPFRAATDFDVYQKIRRAEYRPLPSTLSRDLQEIIASIFTTDAASRPTCAELLEYKWVQAARRDPAYLKAPKLPRMLNLQIKKLIKTSPSSSAETSPRSLSSPSLPVSRVAEPAHSLRSKLATAQKARKRMLEPDSRTSGPARSPTGRVAQSLPSSPSPIDESELPPVASAPQKRRKRRKKKRKSGTRIRKNRGRHFIAEEDEDDLLESARVVANPLKNQFTQSLPAYPMLLTGITHTSRSTRPPTSGIPIPLGGNKLPQLAPPSSPPDLSPLSTSAPSLQLQKSPARDAS
eukprot:TRINITY_DN5349_c0_g1_i1.p1 TRINITY_DN5349_c0_g1~~TRINITY_DN5349_c0_g1_i1.p1  ORF type:complete len:571 (+),score=91.46 TRINITY_DN5349_c0_g1_i1:59-1771(+)